MKVALFKGKGLIGWAIRWQTRSVYSHAALFDGGELIEAREFKGVRAVGYVPGADIDLLDVDGITRDQERAAIQFAREQIGKPYDYTMVARFISRRQATRKESGKWFCSELVFAALQAAGITLLARTEAWEVSPGLLARSPYLKNL